MKKSSHKEKLYFASNDAEFCSSLGDFLHDAMIDGLKEITLVEAVPDNDNTHFVWCHHYGSSVEKFECHKSECSFYASKSGRGPCKHRGQLYTHGNEVVFTVPAQYE